MQSTDLEALNMQARWLAERYERISEGLSSRAGVLLGLLAVELGVLGQIKADAWLLLASVLALLACGVPFILTLAAKSVQFPEISLLVDVATSAETDASKRETAAAHAVTAQLLQPALPAISVVEQFKAESQSRAQWFKRGLVLFAVAQVLVALTVLNGAFDVRNTRTVPDSRASGPCCNTDRMGGSPNGANSQRPGSLRP